MPFYKREFFGVDLASLPAAAKREHHPIGPEVWEQLYTRVKEIRDPFDESWRASKVEYSEHLLTEFIEPWARRHNRAPRILSVGVGLGVGEEVWLKAGHDVTLHECQEQSLEAISQRYPQAPLVYGDLREIEFTPKEYDIIAVLSVEAVFNEDEVVDVLARLRRALKDDGILLIDTASTLSVRQLAAEAVKRVIGYYRKPYIFWAWWRTPGFLASLGRKAGFRIGTIYNVRNAGSRRRLYARPRLIQGWPTLRNSHSMLLMSPGR